MLRREISNKLRTELAEPLHMTAEALLTKALTAYFRIGSVRQISPSRLEEALKFVRQYPLALTSSSVSAVSSERIGVLPRPEGSPSLESARNTLRYFEEWGRDLPEPARTSFLELVEDLKRSVVHDWSALDEACLRIGTGLAMLRRFRG